MFFCMFLFFSYLASHYNAGIFKCFLIAAVNNCHFWKENFFDMKTTCFHTWVAFSCSILSSSFITNSHNIHSAEVLKGLDLMTVALGFAATRTGARIVFKWFFKGKALVTSLASTFLLFLESQRPSAVHTCLGSAWKGKKKKDKASQVTSNDKWKYGDMD